MVTDRDVRYFGRARRFFEWLVLRDGLEENCVWVNPWSRLGPFSSVVGVEPGLQMWKLWGCGAPNASVSEADTAQAARCRPLHGAEDNEGSFNLGGTLAQTARFLRLTKHSMHLLASWCRLRYQKYSVTVALHPSTAGSFSTRHIGH